MAIDTMDELCDALVRLIKAKPITLHAIIAEIRRNWSLSEDLEREVFEEGLRAILNRFVVEEAIQISNGGNA
jgi:hypothetical protein